MNTKRLPRHPNISTILHYFTGHIPSNPYPIDWTADTSLTKSHSLFIVQELLSSFSLKQLITFRDLQTFSLEPSSTGTGTDTTVATTTTGGDKKVSTIQKIVFRVEEVLTMLRY
jgi:hypothetical protein